MGLRLFVNASIVGDHDHDRDTGPANAVDGQRVA
jgi:hypothetical protein